MHLPELGGRRRPTADSPNTGWNKPSFRAYADHMATPAFAEALTADGWELLHIDPRGDTTMHELTNSLSRPRPGSRIRRMQVETHCGRRRQRGR